MKDRAIAVLVSKTKMNSVLHVSAPNNSLWQKCWSTTTALLHLP